MWPEYKNPPYYLWSLANLVLPLSLEFIQGIKWKPVKLLNSDLFGIYFVGSMEISWLLITKIIPYCMPLSVVSIIIFVAHSQLYPNVTQTWIRLICKKKKIESANIFQCIFYLSFAVAIKNFNDFQLLSTFQSFTFWYPAMSTHKLQPFHLPINIFSFFF